MMEAIVEQFIHGHSIHAYRAFGAHFSYEGGNGVRFTVYAPNARSVQIIGDFNNWDGGQHYLERTGPYGVWSIFVGNVSEWSYYKYKIEDCNGNWLEKSDPFAFYSELRPKSASVVVNLDDFHWGDSIWMQYRTKNYQKPLNIYEVHAGSWKKTEDNRFYTYEDLANELIPYCVENGYTHIEFMPLSEYPFDGSWGYQASGYYSCTSRYGSPKQLMQFVNQAHLSGIGIIIDMVPIHFVKDSHGLVKFDGTSLYEYREEKDANSEWGTLNFDLWREEVRSFLMSAASFWLDKYHIDGIRMDAISNLIYWQGNKSRGINDGALAFIRRMNFYLSKEYPHTMLIAEDSSDYPQITSSTYEMGLGFDYKWDLGWMNDTLKYYEMDPIYRSHHHSLITFSMAYFYSERFILPLSHDEVVHGKKAIVDKMFGDYDQKFAQVKNLYLYMYTHPGKKLNFMGNEIAHFREWDENKSMDWFLLNYSRHASFARYNHDLNHIYKYHSALSRFDYSFKGFHWIDADNAKQSVFSYYREDEKSVLVVVLNMQPTSYEEFLIGVPHKGEYIEIMNTEKDIYEGCNMCNYYPIATEDNPVHRFDQSLKIRLAPFAGIIFELKK